MGKVVSINGSKQDSQDTKETEHKIDTTKYNNVIISIYYSTEEIAKGKENMTHGFGFPNPELAEKFKNLLVDYGMAVIEQTVQEHDVH